MSHALAATLSSSRPLLLVALLVGASSVNIAYGEDSARGQLSLGIESLREAPPFEAVYRRYPKAKTGTGLAPEYDLEWLVCVDKFASRVVCKSISAKGGKPTDLLEKSYSADRIEYFDPMSGYLYISNKDLSFLRDLSKEHAGKVSKDYFDDTGRVVDFRFASVSNQQEPTNPILYQYTFLLAQQMVARNRFAQKDPRCPHIRWIDIWNIRHLQPQLKSLEQSSFKQENSLWLDVCKTIPKSLLKEDGDGALLPDAIPPSWKLKLISDSRLTTPNSYLIQQSLMESPWKYDAQGFVHLDKNPVVKYSFEYAHQLDGLKIPMVIPTNIRQEVVNAMDGSAVVFEEIRLVQLKIGSAATQIDPLKAKRIFDKDTKLEIEP